MKKFLFIILIVWISCIYNIQGTFATPEYASMSPTDHGGSITISWNDVINTSNYWNSARADLSKNSWKWYFEYKILGTGGGNVIFWVGTSSANLSDFVGSDSYGWSIYQWFFSVHSSSFVSIVSWSFSVNDVIGVSLDLDSDTISFSVNWTSVWNITGVVGDIFPMVSVNNSSIRANFWASSFAYSVPSWYNSWFYEDVTPTCSLTTPVCSPSTCSLVTGTPTILNQSWVKNASSCGFTCISGYTWINCEIPPSVPITGYFTSPVTVSSGSYNWNMTLNLSSSGTIDDVSEIMLWDAFHVDSATPSGNTIVLALSPTVSPLSVACGTYTVTVPSSLIQWIYGANPDDITGSFSVTGCPTYVSTGSWSSGFLLPNSTSDYMSVMVTSPDGVTYWDVQALSYFFFFALIVSFLVYWLLKISISLIFWKKWEK